MEHCMETSRLILRPWRETDAEALYKYAKDPAIGPIAGWHPHASVEESLEIIRTVFAAPETYALVLKETGEPVGSAGIMRGDGMHSAAMQAAEAEIGYWIGVPYWGQGLVPEAVRCLLHRCFADLGMAAVWCGYYDGNRQSRRVMEKCGFIYHHTETGKVSPLGDIRTEHFMRMTAEEYNMKLVGDFTCFRDKNLLEKRQGMKVEVVPYNPLWRQMFDEEAARIRMVLGKELVDIHHIGSTAVPGLAAKPVIDIMPVVKDIRRVDALNPLFGQLGYECMGEFGIPGRRYFRKGGKHRTHQIHIFQEDNRQDIVRHLAVRDYLRAHPEDADRYAALKQELATRFPADIESYCDGKDAFVRQLQEKALVWYGSR